jgi:hypothetical protein
MEIEHDDTELTQKSFRWKRLRYNAENYFTCPHCSSHRKKKTATCVRMKVEHDHFVGKCYHCHDIFSWRANQNRPAGNALVSRPAQDQRGDFGQARRRNRYGVLS